MATATRTSKRAIGLERENKNSARFCTFLRHHCTTTTSKCRIQRFMENANRRRRIFRSLSKLECSRNEINFREIRLHFTLSANWNKRDKDWKKKPPIQFKRDVLAAIAVVHAKTPHYHPPTENKRLRASLHEKTRASYGWPLDFVSRSDDDRVISYRKHEMTWKHVLPVPV